MITLLSGENSFAIDQEIHRLIGLFDGEVEFLDGSALGAKDIPDLFMGATLFSTQRLIVIRGLSTNASLWNELEQWLERTSDETQLVLVEPKPDKRTRTYKWLQKHATVRQFPVLQDASLRQWVQTSARELGINLEPSVTAFFLSHTGGEQWQLYHELQKLALSNQPITIELIKDIVPESGEASVFSVLDDAFAGNHRRLDEQLHALRVYEDPYRFFGLLSNQVFVLAVAASADGRTADQVAKDAGVHPFVAKKSFALARQLGTGKVGAIVEHIARLDRDLKSLGADPWLLIEASLRTIK